MTKSDWEFKKMVNIPKKDLIEYEKSVRGVKMTEIERIINKLGYEIHKHDKHRIQKLAKAIEQEILKARIKDREATKALMDYTGDTDLWYEDNEEKLAQLKKGLK